MSNYKGQLEGFPSEVVEKMLERQVEQGNKRDVRVFEEFNCANKYHGGFRWANTKEGDDFWQKVIGYKDFTLFFSRYPKKDKFTPISEETGKKLVEAMEKMRQNEVDSLLNFTSSSNIAELTFSSEWQPKEGDVVVNKYNVVGIYKNPRGSVFNFYAALYENKFYTNMNAFNEEIRPATYEERCIFFSRLVNEGYKWNAKKLKLTKWEPKDGDFIYQKDDECEWVSIFKKKTDRDINILDVYSVFQLSGKHTMPNTLKFIEACRLIGDDGIFRKATNSECQQLLDALRKEGKRWNAELKRVEDIEFKVGDCVIGRDTYLPKNAKFVECIDVDNDCPGDLSCRYDNLSNRCSFKFLRHATESEKIKTVSDLYKQGKVWNKKLNRIEDIKPIYSIGDIILTNDGSIAIISEIGGRRCYEISAALIFNGELHIDNNSVAMTFTSDFIKRKANKQEVSKLNEALAKAGYRRSAKMGVIEPLKWKPKMGERYFVPSKKSKYGFNESIWSGSEFDVAYESIGIICRTGEEAQKMLNK